MPSNRDKKRKSRSDSGWYNKPKNFAIHGSEMNDLKDNAKIKRSENKINASIVIMVDRLTGGSHEVDQCEVNGLYDNYRR